MGTYVHKPYLVQIDHEEGRGVKNTLNFDHVVYGLPLAMAIYH